MLVCRTCKRNLALKQGCKICEGDRAVLRRSYGNIFVEEDLLDANVQKSLELLSVELDRLEEDMKEVSEKGNDFQGASDKHVRMITDLSNALAKIAVQARALEKEKATRAKAMSIRQKADLMVNFFATQTREIQDEMVSKLRKEYKGNRWVR